MTAKTKGRCPRCNRLWLFNLVPWGPERRWVRWMSHICTDNRSVFLLPLRSGDRP